MPTTRTSSRPPTSKDVAALAGVSQSTVSFVINGKHNVAKATRQRVEDAMRKLNYRPNAGARTLKTSRTNFISLFVQLYRSSDANETTPYIDEIVAQSRKHDYDVIISTTDEGSAGIERLAGKSICDAFVLMDITPDDPRIPTASALRIPTVLIGRPDDAHGLDVVDFDTKSTAKLMVDELADTGHRHIAVVGDSTIPQPHRHRFIEDFYEGAREEAAARGIDLRIVPRTTDDWNGLSDITPQLLSHADDRLGIIVRQPRLTEWVMRLLTHHGLTPGKDLSVVAHCSDDSAVSFEWPVSNVSTLPEQLSQSAMDILFSRLDGDDSPARWELITPRDVNRRATTVDWTVE